MLFITFCTDATYAIWKGSDYGDSMQFVKHHLLRHCKSMYMIVLSYSQPAWYIIFSQHLLKVALNIFIFFLFYRCYLNINIP